MCGEIKTQPACMYRCPLSASGKGDEPYRVITAGSKV